MLLYPDVGQTDRTTGFPAINVYLCQRSLRPRGDACVTFVEEAGARKAVEELNGTSCVMWFVSRYSCL